MLINNLQVWDYGFSSAPMRLSSCQKPRMLMGFVWQCKRYNWKTQVFWILLRTNKWRASLKPMDSFGTWQKWKLIFFVVNAEFYRVVWTLNALLTVRSEMLPFSGNVWSPPEHYAIGYVHNDNLLRGNFALQYVIQNNWRKIWWCFLMISCTFWRSRRRKNSWIHQNYLVALKVVSFVKFGGCWKELSSL